MIGNTTPIKFSLNDGRTCERTRRRSFIHFGRECDIAEVEVPGIFFRLQEWGLLYGPEPDPRVGTLAGTPTGA